MLTSFVLMAVNLVVAPKFAALSQQGKSDQLERIDLKETDGALRPANCGLYVDLPGKADVAVWRAV